MATKSPGGFDDVIRSNRSGKNSGKKARSKETKGKTPHKRGWNYPRRGLGPIHRWLPSWRFVLASFFAVFALGVAVLGTLYATTKVPNPADFALARATTVYYSDGETVMGTLADYDRNPVALDTLPDYVAHAIVASEDKTFYTNNGISLPSLGRAFLNNIRGGARQGGSTLTQQYVERYFLGTTTSITGKVHEAMIALKIDRQESKDEILQNYLNTIYFGRGAYGIDVASQKYFGIPSSNLTLSQAAMLVAIVPAPSAWDPAVNPERAQERWTRVLRNMVDQGYITQAEADSQTFPETIAPTIGNSFSGPNGYLLSSVVSELVASGKFTADDVNQNGYKIVTTIDKDKQQAAVDAVNALPADRPDNNYVGLMSVDPQTGSVYAMYGGKDYLERQRNSATQDRAQGGSTFKTFGLVAALENGKVLSDTYVANTPMEIDGLEVSNAESGNLGRINMIQATKNSVNTYYVQMNRDVGPEKTKEVAIRAGLPADTPGLDNSLTNVLGSASPTAAEMAKVFATYADRGMQHDIYMVGSITNSAGVEVYSGVNTGKRIFAENVMDTATYAMQSVTEKGATGETAGELGRPVAGKTGTSSGPWSAWFAGYTPQMVTVVNMFQIGPDGGEETLTNFGGITPYISGGSYPADVWLSYMKVATAGMEVQDFPKPDKTLVNGATTKGGTKPTVKETPTEAPSTQPATPTQAPVQPTQPATPSPSPTSEAPSTPAPSDSPTEPPATGGQNQDQSGGGGVDPGKP